MTGTPGPDGPGSVRRVSGQWRGVILAGAASAVGSVALIAVQVALFAVSPPPAGAADALELFRSSPVLAVLTFDGLYIVNNILVLVLYLALTVVLWADQRSPAVLGLLLTVVGMAAYMASNPALELLYLAGHDTAAVDPATVDLLAQSAIDRSQGTAFLVYYELGAVSLLLFGYALLRSGALGRGVGTIALVSGVFMLVPSMMPVVGIPLSLLSLVPWVVLCLMLAARLGRVAHALGGGGGCGPRGDGG